MLRIVLFFKQTSSYERRISDWSSDVFSSDLPWRPLRDHTMTALNNALANGPANGFVYPEQRPLQTMKFWPDLQKLSVDGDEILAAAILDGGTIFWCARPDR